MMKRIFTSSIAAIVTLLSGFGQTAVTDTIAPEQCMASFYFYPLDQPFENGIGYQFIDQSWSDVVSRVWDFGDGTTGNESQPVHYYGLSGDTVEVCLTITSSNGCTSSFCQKFVVGDGQYRECPTSFEILTLESFPPQYRFIPSKPDSFATYFWDFGDGSFSYEMTPSHSYQFSGTYIVCLNYSSPEGCIYFTCDTLLAQGFEQQDCQSFFNAWPTVYNWEDSAIVDSIYLMYPVAYSFIDQSKGDIIQWKWDFGDGTYSEQKNVVHQFQNAGVYNVCLEIYTADSCYSKYCAEIYVEYPSYCQYSGTVKDYTGLDGCGLLIELDNGVVLEPAEIVPDFNLYDGQRVMVGYTVLPDRASICMAGLIVRIDCIIETNDDSCDVSFRYYEMDWLSSMLPVYQFEMISDIGVDEAQWTFSDGTITNAFAPVHSFLYDGFYTVCLKVASSNGCTASYCDSAWFKGKNSVPGLCENFIRLETSILLNGQICNGAANVSLEDRYGNQVPAYSWLWSTGETEPYKSDLCPGQIYSVVATDATGCAVSGSFTFGAPVTYPDSLIGRWNYEQYDMDFIFNLPVYSDSVYCEWDFGDGQVANGSVVNHTYSSPENYTVHLKVFDNFGNMLYTEQIMVSPGIPTNIRNREKDAPVIYPIPATERIFVEYSGTEEIESVGILNASGQTAKIFSDIDQAGQKLELNVSDLPAGFYIGRLTYRSGTIQTFKFVK